MDSAPSNPRVDAELRLGIQPIHELQAERAALVNRHATLRTDHGTFGKWDAKRKVMLCTIKVSLRARYHASGVKTTESQLDDEAHAHPDYTAFITKTTLEADAWFNVENGIRNINETIERDNLLGRHATAETRMG